MTPESVEQALRNALGGFQPRWAMVAGSGVGSGWGVGPGTGIWPPGRGVFGAGFGGVGLIGVGSNDLGSFSRPSSSFKVRMTTMLLNEGRGEREEFSPFFAST